MIIVIGFAVSNEIFHSEYNTEPTPSPTQTLNPTPSPTQTLNPTPSPTQTLNPTPSPTQTPIPTSEGHVYVIGINVFGGDLQGNTIQLNTLNEGESRNISFCVQSTSDEPITLSFWVTDWSPPELGSFLQITWDYNGFSINPNQTIMLTFTLTSSLSADFTNYIIDNNVTTFSFNLYIFPE